MPPHRVTAWLLLLPALVLLVAFTHYPALATLLDSFFSTPKAGRPARFVGLDNYRGDGRRPGVLAGALATTSGSRVGTIPLSIALAMLMALWVNGRMPGARFLRMAYFTPTVLPMIAVANIWLFFYTPQIRPARPDHAARSALPQPQLARRPAHRARLR